MKIYITGGPGSGKTMVANSIAKKYSVGKLSLDDIVWDKYYKKEPKEERDKNLHNFLCANKSWVIEGTYFNWLFDLFTAADLIIFIQTNVILRDFRIFKRFFLKKISGNSNENIKNLLHMLSWNHEYEVSIKEEFIFFTKKFSSKIISIKDKNKLEFEPIAYFEMRKNGSVASVESRPALPEIARF